MAQETDEMAETAAETPETEAPSDGVTQADPPVIQERTVVRKAGFGVALLGGAVAAGLGVLGGYQLWGEGQAALRAELATLQSRLNEVEARPTGPDEAAISAAVAASEERLSGELATGLAPVPELGGRVDAVDAAMEALSERIAVLERAPSGDGNLSETAVAAWEAELASLRADMDALTARMDGLAEETAAALEAAQEEAVALDTASQQRAALARIAAAIDTGTGYAEPLADLTAVSEIDIPAELSASAAEGVPTLAELQASFPDAARAALSAVRDEGGEGGGLTGFLRNTFEVRSVTPRDGDDPDAILSRAEAAVADNHLTDALSEIAALPEVARGAMSGWIADAETRLAALASVQGLSDTLTEN